MSATRSSRRWGTTLALVLIHATQLLSQEVKLTGPQEAVFQLRSGRIAKGTLLSLDSKSVRGRVSNREFTDGAWLYHSVKTIYLGKEDTLSYDTKTQTWVSTNLSKEAIDRKIAEDIKKAKEAAQLENDQLSQKIDEWKNEMAESAKQRDAISKKVKDLSRTLEADSKAGKYFVCILDGGELNQQIHKKTTWVVDKHYGTVPMEYEYNDLLETRTIKMNVENPTDQVVETQITMKVRFCHSGALGGASLEDDLAGWRTFTGTGYLPPRSRSKVSIAIDCRVTKMPSKQTGTYLVAEYYPVDITVRPVRTP